MKPGATKCLLRLRVLIILRVRVLRREGKGLGHGLGHLDVHKGVELARLLFGERFLEQLAQALGAPLVVLPQLLRVIQLRLQVRALRLQRALHQHMRPTHAINEYSFSQFP